MADDFTPVPEPGSGGKANPLKKLMAAIKKQPMIGFAIVGALLGLFWFFRNQKSSTATQTVAAPDTSAASPAVISQGGGGGGDITAMSDVLSMYSQANDQRFENIEQTVQGYASQTSQGFSALQETIGALSEQTASRFNQINLGGVTNPQVSTTPVTPVTQQPTGSNRDVGGSTQAVASFFDQQVAAAKQITNLSAAWKTLEAQEATMTPAQKAASDAQQAALHQQAETLGASAGFGLGGASGTTRIIPESVKTAAGIGG